MTRDIRSPDHAAFVQSIAKAPSAVLERFASDWVPLFLAHAAAKSTAVDSEPASKDEDAVEDEDPDGNGEPSVTILSRIGSRHVNISNSTA